MAEASVAASVRARPPARALLAAVAAAVLAAACSGLPGAREELAEAQATAPKTPEAAQAELKKATIYWGQEYAKNPHNTKAALAYAKNLKAMGQKEQALAVFQHASIHGADNKELASEYGRLALDLDQVALAETLLARAEDPANPDWRVVSAQGATRAKQGRHREAQPLFERALALSPNNPSVMNNLAMAYAMDGQAPKAEELLRQAMALPNASPRVKQNLALVLGLQGKFDDAKQVAAGDLPPEQAAANIAYLQKMVDAQPAALKKPAVPDKATQVATAQRKPPAAPLKKPSNDAIKEELASNGWSTEVTSLAQPVALTPARKP